MPIHSLGPDMGTGPPCVPHLEKHNASLEPSEPHGYVSQPDKCHAGDTDMNKHLVMTPNRSVWTCESVCLTAADMPYAMFPAPSFHPRQALSPHKKGHVSQVVCAHGRVRGMHNISITQPP